MIKIGRNDRCLCGSGKKYKKCCMNKQYLPNKLNLKDKNNFQDLIPRIFDYSKEFDDQLQPFYQRYTNTFERLYKQDAQAFSQLLFHWLLFNAPLVDGKNTIMEKYISENQDSYSDAFQPLLEQWGELKPQLFSVKEVQKDSAVLIDSITNSITIPESTAATKYLSEGDLLVGYLYPTPDGVALGNDAVIVPTDLNESFLTEWKSLYEHYNSGQDEHRFFIKEFPAILGILTATALRVLPPVIEDELEDLPVKVLQDLARLVQLHDYSYDVFLEAKMKWSDFVASASPRISKPEVFAAVLEYWMSKQPKQWNSPSQKALGEKYGVSPGTISSRYNDFVKGSENVLVRIPRG